MSTGVILGMWNWLNYRPGLTIIAMDGESETGDRVSCCFIGATASSTPFIPHRTTPRCNPVVLTSTTIYSRRMMMRQPLAAGKRYLWPLTPPQRTGFHPTRTLLLGAFC